MPNPTLRASAVAFSTKPRVGDATGGHTGARVKRVVGLIDTTITLLEYNGQRLCIFASHFGTAVDDATVNLQNALSDTLQLSAERILIFSSHNHSVPQIEPRQRTGYEENPKPAGLTAFGRAFAQQVQAAAKKLPAKLEPVSVWYGEGHESRITYNRKGRRADGSTYLMREEDRALLGGDFAGGIIFIVTITCGGSGFHGRVAAHAAILFIDFTRNFHDFTRRLAATGQEATEDDGIGEGEGFDDVA